MLASGRSGPLRSSCSRPRFLTKHPALGHNVTRRSHICSYKASSTTQEGCVRTEFSVPLPTTIGEVVKLVGGSDEMGRWSADNGFTLEWSEGNVWMGGLDLQPGQKYEFKIVVYNNKDQGQRWEDGGNRVVDTPSDPKAELKVLCEFGNPDSTMVQSVAKGAAATSAPAADAPAADAPAADAAADDATAADAETSGGGAASAAVEEADTVPGGWVDLVGGFRQVMSRAFGGGAANANAEESTTETAPAAPQVPEGYLMAELSVTCSVEDGEVLKLVGGSEEMGQWDAAKGLELTCGADNVWSSTMPLKLGQQYEFKAVAFNPSTKALRWEDGANRVLAVPSEASAAVLKAPFTFGDGSTTLAAKVAAAAPAEVAAEVAAPAEAAAEVAAPADVVAEVAAPAEAVAAKEEPAEMAAAPVEPVGEEEKKVAEQVEVVTAAAEAAKVVEKEEADLAAEEPADTDATSPADADTAANAAAKAESDVTARSSTASQTGLSPVTAPEAVGEDASSGSSSGAALPGVSALMALGFATAAVLLLPPEKLPASVPPSFVTSFKEVQAKARQVTKDMKLQVPNVSLPNDMKMPDMPAFEMPDMPDMSTFEMPEMPEMPDMPTFEMPDMSKFEMPDMSKLEMPEMPDMPTFEMPDMSKLEMPDMPKLVMPEMPEMPDLPEMPKFEMPDMSKFEMPEMPEMPDMPDMPKLAMPEMPEAPKMEMPDMPDLPKKELPATTEKEVAEVPDKMPEVPKMEMSSIPKKEVDEVSEKPEMNKTETPEVDNTEMSSASEKKVDEVSKEPEVPKMELPDTPKREDLEGSEKPEVPKTEMSSTPKKEVLEVTEKPEAPKMGSSSSPDVPKEDMSDTDNMPMAGMSEMSGVNVADGPQEEFLQLSKAVEVVVKKMPEETKTEEPVKPVIQLASEATEPVSSSPQPPAAETLIAKAEPAPRGGAPSSAGDTQAVIQPPAELAMVPEIIETGSEVIVGAESETN